MKEKLYTAAGDRTGIIFVLFSQEFTHLDLNKKWDENKVLDENVNIQPEAGGFLC